MSAVTSLNSISQKIYKNLTVEGPVKHWFFIGTIIIPLVVVMVIVSCSDEKTTDPLPLPVVGTWVLSGFEQNGVESDVPEDTLIFKSDLSGNYRSTIGWGWYDFSYEFKLDTLIFTRTDGQFAGFVDTAFYEFAHDTLILTRGYDTPDTIVNYWVK